MISMDDRPRRCPRRNMWLPRWLLRLRSPVASAPGSQPSSYPPCQLFYEHTSVATYEDMRTPYSLPWISFRAPLAFFIAAIVSALKLADSRVFTCISSWKRVPCSRSSSCSVAFFRLRAAVAADEVIGQSTAQLSYPAVKYTRMPTHQACS